MKINFATENNKPCIIEVDNLTKDYGFGRGVFDRSKRSMAIGGGLSIFALVAAMLGLFGSPVIPSVVRLDALNNFNYVTIISLFDVISIIEGTSTFILKFAILAVAGIIGYIAGSTKFIKKDLPL